MTELRCALIGRGLVQSLSRSSLRMQGPITPGLKSEKGLCSSAEGRVRAVWVPAFAGTTCWKIPYAIALPHAGRGESDRDSGSGPSDHPGMTALINSAQAKTKPETAAHSAS